jgi:hypothetical protein
MTLIISYYQGLLESTSNSSSPWLLPISTYVRGSQIDDTGSSLLTYVFFCKTTHVIKKRFLFGLIDALMPSYQGFSVVTDKVC